MAQDMILSGATGNTGQVIAGRLLELGIPFKAMVRSEAARARLAARGIPTVPGDFDDPPSLVRALQGAERAYLVCTPDEKLIPREAAFIAAAQKAGVRQIVYCSAYMAAPDGETQNLRSHGVIERGLADSGLDYTIIRPHGFMQTYTLLSWDMIRKAGVFSLPGGDGPAPLVDVRDVATVAVKSLTESGHEGKAYDLTGPELLTFAQMAETLQKVLGRPVTYVPGNEQQFVFIMSLLGVPATPREHAIKILRMQREGRFTTIHPTLRELGIEPTTYEQFVRDLAADQTGGGNSFRPPDTPMFRLLNAVMPAMARLSLYLYRRSHH